MLIHSSVTGRRQWPPPVLTSAVCEAVEDVAFVTEALEASRRVDTEMVAGAVKGALVDVCVQRNTHSGKTPQITESATFPRCPLFYRLLAGGLRFSGKEMAFERKTSPACYLQQWSTSRCTYFYHFEAQKWNLQWLCEITSCHSGSQNKVCSLCDNRSNCHFH